MGEHEKYGSNAKGRKRHNVHECCVAVCACMQHRALQKNLPLNLSGIHPLLHLQSGLLVFCPNQVLPDISSTVSSYNGAMSSI